MNYKSREGYHVNGLIVTSCSSKQCCTIRRRREERGKGGRGGRGKGRGGAREGASGGRGGTRNMLRQGQRSNSKSADDSTNFQVRALFLDVVGALRLDNP